MKSIQVPSFAHFFVADKRSAAIWLLLRIYVGWMWVSAGWGKLHNPAWVGDSSGAAIIGFVTRALEKTTGPHPDVQGWYATFLQQVVLPHPALWAYMVSMGEFLVGVALLAGFLVGISAFFGVFMNLSFLLAGTVSTNPIFLILGIFLILAWRVSGYIGADYYVLPFLRKFFRPRLGT